MIDRNLDGVYFRIKRGDRWKNICFSDLNEKEMDDVLADKSDEWLRRLCKILANALRYIGDELDIVMD